MPEFDDDATVDQMAREYIDLMVKAAYHKNKMTEANKAINAMGGRLFDEMHKIGMTETVINGVKLSPEVKQSFSLRDDLTLTNKWDDYPGWFEWLRNNGRGGAIKTRESVAPGTRDKLLREVQEAGELLPPFVKETLYNTVEQKRSKAAIEEMAAEYHE